MLTNVQYRKIRNWIYRNARPLDLARWQYHFEEGSQLAVLKALEAYQNEDGGFGHALEADCWNPNSSPLQTWWATQFLKEVGLKDPEHPIVRGILRYLASGDGTMDDGRWLFSVPGNNDWPHAPWWEYREDRPESGYNPSAALAGYILAMGHTEEVLYSKAGKMAASATEKQFKDGKPIEMHELSCFIELYNDLRSNDIQGITDLESLANHLKEQVNSTIERDSSKWLTEYCCKPSHFFIMPDSPFYEDNKELIDRELSLLCDTLSEEGTWPVTWAWGSYDKEFAVSSRWWQANIIIQNMRLLKAYGQT